MKLAGLVISIALLVGSGMAADAPTPVPDNVQNKLLKAQHDFDALVGQEKDQQLAFEQALRTQKEIQAAYPELDTKTKAAEKALEAAKDDALHAAGMDKTKYDVDMKTLTFVSKTPTAPTSTSEPAKK